MSVIQMVTESTISKHGHESRILDVQSNIQMVYVPSWVHRPNPEDRINREPLDQKKRVGYIRLNPEGLIIENRKAEFY